MFTTLVLKYGTTFMNLFALSIAATHFGIGILLLAFHENKPVKVILLAARGIYFIIAVITTFVMIGEDVKLYAFVGWILILLALTFAVIRVIFAEWYGAAYNRGGRRYSTLRAEKERFVLWTPSPLPECADSADPHPQFSMRKLRWYESRYPASSVSKHTTA